MSGNSGSSRDSGSSDNILYIISLMFFSFVGYHVIAWATSSTPAVASVPAVKAPLSVAQRLPQSK